MNAFAGDLAERFALLLGLSLFFGFAFEEFYSGELPRRPGGVRTFPLLALAGGGLYLVEPKYGAAFVAGLVVVGSWIYAYVRRESKNAASAVEGAFVVPACNLLAFTLGAIALTQPLWLAVGVAVAAVLLLGGRRTLHDWAARVSTQEVVTAAQFLILVGVVLPVLAGRPPIPYTTITPFGVWLAVVAVSSISYASYLLQRYVFPNGGTLLTSVLGGLYSSTAATAVLARRMRDEGPSPELEAGIVAATAMMYARILVVCCDLQSRTCAPARASAARPRRGRRRPRLLAFSLVEAFGATRAIFRTRCNFGRPLSSRCSSSPSRCSRPPLRAISAAPASSRSPASSASPTSTRSS